MPDELSATLRKLLVEVSEIKTDVRTIKREDLPRIEAQVRKTNGRVTQLELERATERGAALQRAATIEDVRVVRASDLARNAWIRPGIVALVAASLAATLSHFLG